jgi:hypothetical protein
MMEMFVDNESLHLRIQGVLAYAGESEAAWTVFLVPLSIVGSPDQIIIDCLMELPFVRPGDGEIDL